MVNGAFFGLGIINHSQLTLHHAFTNLQEPCNLLLMAVVLRSGSHMGKLFIFDTPKLTTMKKVFLFSLTILVFASGCREIAGRRVRGSGHITSQTRSVSGFNNVHVSGAIDVL
jgi:hypothetical protein